VRKGHLVASNGEDRYLPGVDRLTLPLSFMHGAANRCVLPAATEASHDLVAQRVGPERVRRVVVPGYGNMDFLIGRNAAVDVFPHIVEHLRWADKCVPVAAAVELSGNA
jgi:cholesterol oxidase